MSGPLRVATIGLCVLLAGALSPTVAVATPTPQPTPPISSVPTSNAPTASTSYSLSPNEFSLGISPTRLVIGQADIGTVQKILVVNRGQASVAVTMQKRNFTAGSDGSLSYQEDARFGAANWVGVSPASFEVEPGATQTVTATITMPVAPEPGDHQVALVFLVPAGQTDANIKINRGIATPVFITVPGPIDTTALLSNLAAPGFAINGPVSVTATVTNTGTVHRDFRGESPLLIDTAGATAAFPDFTVLRGSVRDISTTWDPPLMCICNPTVQFTNADGSVQSATVRVIVFPLHLLAILLAALLLVALTVFFTRRGYRASVMKAAAALNRPVGRGDA